MLDVFIIEELRRQERKRKEQLDRKTVDLPLPAEDRPEDRPAPESSGGSVIVIDVIGFNS
jgi:hypothetical protein